MIDVDIRTRLHSFLLTASFEVEDELLTLVGPSGAGKSIVLRSIAGIYTPDDGTITCDGDTLFNAVLSVNRPPNERRIGYIPQNFALFPHLDVGENIAFPLRRTMPADSPEVAARVDDVIDLLRLGRYRRQHPADLAPTERVWVAIARALIIDPELLLLDETFAGLDQGPRQQVRSGFASLRRAIGVPTIVATGELEEACNIGDRVAVLDSGRILQVDEPAKLRSRPTDRHVARLLGASNVLAGTVVDSAGGWVTATTPIGDLRFPGENPWGHELDIVLRPELLRVVAMGAGSGRPPAGGTVLPATIVDTMQDGADHLLYVQPDASRTEDAVEVRLSDLAYQQNSLAGHERCWLVLPDDAIHAMPRHAAQTN